MYCSWLAAKYTLPPPGKSYSHLETGYLVYSVSQEHCLNTSWKLSFLDLGIRQALVSPDYMVWGMVEVELTSQAP